MSCSSSSSSTCGECQGYVAEPHGAGCDMPADMGGCDMGAPDMGGCDMGAGAVDMGCGAAPVVEEPVCAPAPPQKCYDTVTMYRMEPYQAQVPFKKTIMVEKTVPVIQCKQVPRQIPATKQVTQTVDEPYIKTVTVQVPGTKKVQKNFTVPSTREVFEMVKVPTKITVPVQKMVDDMKMVTKYKTVPYQVQVPSKKMITVQEQRDSFRMEKITKTVPYQKTEMRWVDEPTMNTVTKQIPATRRVQKMVTVPFMRTVMENVKVAGTKTVNVPEVVETMKCVTKYRRVPYQKCIEVPCPVPEPTCPVPEPCPAPAPAPCPMCNAFHACA